MGFKLKNVVKTGVSPVNALLQTGYGNLKPNQVTQDQIPLETPEQRTARQMLLGFSQTGKFGDFTAGQDIGLQPGDYGMTAPERTGMSSLQSLLSSGIPEQFRLGNDELARLLNPDPNAVSAQFDPFRAQVQRQTKEATTAAKRNSAYLGNLYSANAVRDIGDVQARGNETLTAELARLTDAALSRRAAAVPLAFQAGQAQEGLSLGRIQAAQQFGGLPRELNNARNTERNAEILRRRSELTLPLQTASSVAGTNANFGVPSITTSQPSTLMELLGLLVKGGATYAAAKGG